MSQSYVCAHVHYVFGTTYRTELITSELEEKLYPYFALLAVNIKAKQIAAGGTVNHVHLLLSLPATLSIAQLAQRIKGASSHWISERYNPSFAWQDGYGAFCVSRSLLDKTIDYIRRQKIHHRTENFEHEFAVLLDAHGIDYNIKHLFPNPTPPEWVEGQ